MPTLRTAEVDMVQNDEALEINLDLLEEKREHAAIREAKNKAKMKKYYNSKVAFCLKTVAFCLKTVAFCLKTVAFCLKTVAFCLKTHCVLPNGKMIVDSIENGPYVRRMIATPGEPDLPVPVPESLHEQTDEELTETDIKRMDADDQAIQTILLGLPEDVYATVDSCETTKEIWERNQQGFNAWQNGGIQGAQNASVQRGGNHNGLVVVTGNANQSGTGNVVAARAEGIQLQAEEFDFVAAAEQYTDLLEPIPEPQLVPQNDNHVTSISPSMVHSGGTVETSSAPNEEIRSHQETVYRNLVDQVARTMHMLNPKPDSFYHPNQKMALGYPNPLYLKKAQQKQQSLYNGNLMLKEHDAPVVYDLEETLELAQESREKMRLLKKEIKPANYAKINHLSRVFVPQTTKSKEEL
nr:reverse transcriptase domain-containing protein [Tanacetum cinerariifolium]